MCGKGLFDEPLLRYKNMPMVAQNLPDERSLGEDKGVDLTVCQCSGCGLVQLDSEPVPYYKDVIRAAAFSPEMKIFREEQFKEFVKEYELGEKKVLEPGCGRGEYLALMKEAGVDAYGLEHAQDSVDFGVKNGLQVFKGFIDSENYYSEHGPFDAFFTLNFLEHLPDPNSYLRGIYANLADNGVGIIEVPSFDMLVRNDLFSEFTRDHLFYFTKETLSTLLTLNGFEIIRCDEIWYDYIISAVVKKRLPLPLDGFIKKQAEVKKDIEEFLENSKSIAVWGAGHQAFAIMAMMDLGDRIKYVVDSAPFKQGKYAPATHIPIVAPDMLRTDPVDTIIIIAASYSSEVARIVAEQFGNQMRIAILRDFGLEKL